MQYRSGIVAAVAMVAMVAGAAQADVFNMPTGQTSLQFVTVGDPGNAADTTVMNDGTTGYGSVPYDYQMGKYDVTVGQYVQFLNAVAKTDTYGLYNSYHGHGLADGTSDHRDHPKRQFGQLQLLGHGQLQPSRQLSDLRCHLGRCGPLLQLAAKRPADRGRGAGHDGNRGVHAQRRDHQSALMAITRNAGATYFIPSENEWYKAAYYKGGGTNGGYWTIRLRATPHLATCFRDRHEQRQLYKHRRLDRPTNQLTPVGRLHLPGPYGTYDMGGDVWRVE